MLRTFLLCSFLAAVTSLAVNTNGEYLIKQGILDDGSLFMYSPYVLWHSDIQANSSTLKNPLELRSLKGVLAVTLTVKAVTIQNEKFSFNTRVFCYNDVCASPAPTLYCSPGDTLKLTLVNDLVPTSGVSTAGPLEGQEIFPNRTNIFIQGLQLDPARNNPYRFTSGGGDTIVYEHKIPVDAPPGVHWYHSRVHGVSALHVQGGLFGALIIDPAGITATYGVNNTLTYTAPLPKTLNAVLRRVVVFSHVMLEPVHKDIPGVQKGDFSLIDEAGKQGFTNSSLSYTYLSKAYGSRMPINASYNGTALSDVWLANGQYQPTLTLQPGEWRILDIVVASGDRIIELEVRTQVGFGVGSSVCDVSAALKNWNFILQALYFLIFLFFRSACWHWTVCISTHRAVARLRDTSPSCSPGVLLWQ
jgi:FtsP/CotA-like multicopper oxidase with cupredoxin domain